MSAQAVAAALLLSAWFGWTPFAPPLPAPAEVAECLAEPQAAVRRLHAGSLFFCGRIDAVAVERVRAALVPTDRALVIASFGGDLDAPLELAEIVRDRRLTVTVVGPCISGCASFVFVAGSGRFVTQGAVIAMHNTATSALYLARAATGNQLSSADRPLEDRSRREEAFYQSVGVHPSLLVEPQVRLGTMCVEIGARDARSGETQFLIHSNYSLWAPTRAQWAARGINFSGTLPATDAQAQRLLRRAGLSTAVTVVFDRSPLVDVPEAVLATVRQCQGG